jgi:hypothetical protein
MSESANVGCAHAGMEYGTLGVPVCRAYFTVVPVTTVFVPVVVVVAPAFVSMSDL